jgi:hypothetical protein
MTVYSMETLDYLRERKAAYQIAFTGPHGERVMVDLRMFCSAEKTCFHADPRIHARLEGRRDVFLRIQEHLNYGLEDLAALYGAVSATTDGDPNE